MKIQWTSVNDAMPEEGRKIYISGDNFVTQAFYHIGMYWQDANLPRRYALNAVNQWCDVEEAQRTIDANRERSEQLSEGLPYFFTTDLEQKAVDYAEAQQSEDKLALGRAYLAGYAEGASLLEKVRAAREKADELARATIDTLGAYKSTEVNDGE